MRCQSTTTSTLGEAGHRDATAPPAIDIRSGIWSGGEGEIRTPGTGLGQYDGLANRCFRPLSHLSGSIAPDFSALGSMPAHYTAIFFVIGTTVSVGCATQLAGFTSWTASGGSLLITSLLRVLAVIDGGDNSLCLQAPRSDSFAGLPASLKTTTFVRTQSTTTLLLPAPIFISGCDPAVMGDSFQHRCLRNDTNTGSALCLKFAIPVRQTNL